MHRVWNMHVLYIYIEHMCRFLMCVSDLGMYAYVYAYVYMYAWILCVYHTMDSIIWICIC